MLATVKVNYIDGRGDIDFGTVSLGNGNPEAIRAAFQFCGLRFIGGKEGVDYKLVPTTMNDPRYPFGYWVRGLNVNVIVNLSAHQEAL